MSLKRKRGSSQRLSKTLNNKPCIGICAWQLWKLCGAVQNSVALYWGMDQKATCVVSFPDYYHSVLLSLLASQKSFPLDFHWVIGTCFLSACSALRLILRRICSGYHCPLFLVLALGETFISMSGSSRVKKKYPLISKLNDSCFCYLMAAMFVPLRPETEITSTPGGRQSFAPMKFQKKKRSKGLSPNRSGSNLSLRPGR